MATMSGDWSPHLRFNSRVNLNSNNLATHFDPASQSPVVVQKLGNLETVGLSRTPRSAFKAVDPERLAYAVELAKRNVHSSRRFYSEVRPASTLANEKTMPVQNPPKSIATVQKDYAISSSQPKKNNALKRLPRRSSKPYKGESRESSTSQILQLNAELQRRLLMISKDNSREITNGHKQTNRLRWAREEEEENEEKLKRWRKEQQARNARMMYDLSQQVRLRISHLQYTLPSDVEEFLTTCMHEEEL